MNLFKLLDEAEAANASDLHLSTNSRPPMGVNGTLAPIPGYQALTRTDLSEAFAEVATPGREGQILP